MIKQSPPQSHGARRLREPKGPATRAPTPLEKLGPCPPGHPSNAPVRLFLYAPTLVVQMGSGQFFAFARTEDSLLNFNSHHFFDPGRGEDAAQMEEVDLSPQELHCLANHQPRRSLADFLAKRDLCDKCEG